jgi:propanediol utilization protein
MISEIDLKQNILTATLIAVYKKTGIIQVPVNVSARHIHLCKGNMEKLFGVGHELTPFRELIQPGNFAAEEKVSLVGPKGRIDNVRVLGPLRSETQIEISFTDALKLGVDPVLRMSGDLKGTGSIKMETARRSINIPAGLISARRHLHMTDEEAKIFGLSNGDVVRLKKSGPRETIFGQFVVRCGPEHRLEAHLDTDEANAAMVRDGDLLELVP